MADRSAALSRLTYAIGDVHGRLDPLQVVLDRCRNDAILRSCKAPLYVFLGDYVDRGSASAGVIRFLRAFSREHSTIALRGNHDQMMIDTVLGGDDGICWAANGMASTAASYGYRQLVTAQMPADQKRAAMVRALRSDPQAVDDASWLNSLPLLHEDRHRLYVHAGLRPELPLSHQCAHDLLWIREPFLRYPKAHTKLVVHGHTPTQGCQPEVRSNRIGIDTGAVWSGVLTAAVFSEDRPLSLTFLTSMLDSASAAPSL